MIRYSKTKVVWTRISCTLIHEFYNTRIPHLSFTCTHIFSYYNICVLFYYNLMYVRYLVHEEFTNRNLQKITKYIFSNNFQVEGCHSLSCLHYLQASLIFFLKEFLMDSRIHFLAYSKVWVDDIALCHPANENYVVISIKTCRESSLIFWKHVPIFQCSVHIRCNCHLTTLYLQVAFQGSWSLGLCVFSSYLTLILHFRIQGLSHEFKHTSWLVYYIVFPAQISCMPFLPMNFMSPLTLKHVLKIVPSFKKM